MRKPLVALIALLFLAHLQRPAYGQTVGAVSASPMPLICQAGAGEKNDRRGVDAVQRGMVREDERFMAVLKTKEAVWQSCVKESLQCACDMKVSEKGLGLSCSPREKGLIRKATQEWHLIGIKDLESQFFAVEKAGDGYKLADLCLARITFTGVPQVDMSWQDLNLAGELARMKSEIRFKRVQGKITEITGRLKP